MKKLIMTAVALLALGAGASIAEAKKAPKNPAAAAAKSEKSKACTKEADEKKLHGKARKTFRKECMKKA